MILLHRKRHLYTWVVLAVLLPVLFYLAWYSIPESYIKVPGENLNEIYVNYNYQAPTSILELEIQSSKSSAGDLILVGENDNSRFDECMILGQIDGSGTYRFQVSKNLHEKYLLFYNPFNKSITQSIKL
jgi:hypothetical protein